MATLEKKQCPFSGALKKGHTVTYLGCVGSITELLPTGPELGNELALVFFFSVSCCTSTTRKYLHIWSFSMVMLFFLESGGRYCGPCCGAANGDGCVQLHRRPSDGDGFCRLLRLSLSLRKVALNDQSFGRAAYLERHGW